MNQRTTNLAQLRQRAEKALAQTREKHEWHNTDLHRLIEELCIYHTELEIQHQELQQSQISQAIALDKYRSLFDFSPIPALLVDDVGSSSKAIAQRRHSWAWDLLYMVINTPLHSSSMTGYNCSNCKAPCALAMKPPQ